jgi:hypothetical protein
MGRPVRSRLSELRRFTRVSFNESAHRFVDAAPVARGENIDEKAYDGDQQAKLKHERQSGDRINLCPGYRVDQGFALAPIIR